MLGWIDEIHDWQRESYGRKDELTKEVMNLPLSALIYGTNDSWSYRRVYLSSGRAYGKTARMEKAKREHEAFVGRVTKDVQKRWAPASAAEAKWAGYGLRVRRYTAEERAARREWRWMNGYWGAGATEEMLNDPRVWGMYTQVDTMKAVTK